MLYIKIKKVELTLISFLFIENGLIFKKYIYKWIILYQ